jgi:hypothetical protein
MLNQRKILDVSDNYLATLSYALFSLCVKTLRIKAANNATSIKDNSRLVDSLSWEIRIQLFAPIVLPKLCPA